MSPESFTLEQKEVVRGLVRAADEYRNAMVFGQIVVEVAKMFGFHPIVQMEELLRKMESDTYLLAMPFTPEMSDFSAKMLCSDEEYPYYLWICVNGREEAEAKMKEIETNAEQNLMDLERTGMLVAKPGSDIANASRAHLN